MGRLGQSMFYSLLVTIYGGSIFYLYNLVMAIANGTGVVGAFTDTLVSCFVCWVFFGFVFYEIAGLFEEFNQRGRGPNQDSPDSRSRPNDDSSNCP